MTPRTIFAVAVPAIAAIAVLALLNLLDRRLRRRGNSAGFRLSLRLRLLALIGIALYLAIIAVGPLQFWAWYSSGIDVPARDILIAIAGIAITAWSGCLIAFSVKRRLTPELSRGLRFMIYACFVSLLTLTHSGIALRSVAALAAAYWGAWAILQFRPPLRRKVRVDLILKPVDADAPGPVVMSFKHFALDRLAEYLAGWQWSAALCLLAIAVFAWASEDIVVGCSLFALCLGVSLAFYALVTPETGDSGFIL